MLGITSFTVFTLIGISLASTPPPIPNISNDQYQYVVDEQGQKHLVDLLLTPSDVVEASRYNPTTSNVYHLFTRQNPTVSQPIVYNNAAQLATTNFDSSKRTIVLIHGWRGSVMSNMNLVLIPTILAAEDVNIIVVDWSEGASSLIYRIVIVYTIRSGSAVADFIKWINQFTGATPSQYHIIGHGFGGHQAGIVGRNVGGIGYVTGLNPALVGWVSHPDRFAPNDGIYTEVIHTNYVLGYIGDLAHVDFYPNGGISMPGCDSNECDDARSIYFFAESITSGGFTGMECLNYYAAVLSLCDGSVSLKMGGLTPKTGSRGVYILDTNAGPPFSQG